MSTAFGTRLETLGRRLRRYVELELALSLLLVTGLAWGFAEIADAVSDGQTHELDRSLLLALREHGDPSNPIGPRWMHEVGRDITALGGHVVLGLIALGAFGYLIIRRKYGTSAVLAAGVLGATVSSHALKELFGRPRPDLVPHFSEVYTASFPSGHSTMAAATFLTIGMLFARVHHARRVRVYVMTLAVVLVVLVGVSRVYLGVHWPSDVLAGWALGTVWAILVWSIARWIERRRSRARVVDEEPATRLTPHLEP